MQNVNDYLKLAEKALQKAEESPTDSFWADVARTYATMALAAATRDA